MNASTPSVETILEQAVAIAAPADRQAFVEQACGGDAELQRQVERLIDNHFRAGSFLEKPAAALDRKATTVWETTEGAVGVGTVIGPYKLLEQIGEGGMGLVFVAEQQQPIKRRVALKIIKPGMDTRQVIAPFEAERQALALMDHPNIAKVHDGGATPEGRPYFVMELVKGTPITDYCDTHRLSTRQRLELFLDVCRAVQHAHQKGIIHRDLKPSNVLVEVHDVRPVVKVIDFGIAKATGQQLTDKSFYTGIAQLVGTPLYLSPEQAGLSSLDVDTRSDVYSLGVVLYELLTGTTPLYNYVLQKAGYDEMRRIIREDEPPRPSTRLCTMERAALSTIAERRGSETRRLSQQLRGELDWIVMKALEKDRNRRYESTGAFAADVQRYLDDEPVQACPPSTWYRLRKFVHRNRAAVGVAACVLIGTAVFAVTTTWLQRQKAILQTQVEGEAKLALRDAELLQGQQKWTEATAAAKRARGLLRAGESNEVLSREIDRRVADLTLAATLDQIVTDKLVRLADRHWSTLSDPEIDARFAQAFQDAGIDVQELSVEAAAALIHERSIGAEIAAALDNWTDVRSASSGQKDPFWKKLQTLASAVDPDPFRVKLRIAWAECTNDTKVVDPKEIIASPRLLEQRMSVLHSFALSVFFFAGKSEAWKDLLLQMHRRHPEDFWINFHLATEPSMPPMDLLRFSTAAVAIRPANTGAHLSLGEALKRMRRFDEAITQFREAIRLGDSAQARFMFGNALRDKGDWNGAIKEFRESLRLKDDPETHNNLGIGLAETGRLDEAIAEYRTAIKLKPKYAMAHNNLGNALYHSGHPDEAFAEYRAAIKLNPRDPDAYSNLGAALQQTGRLDEALAACQQALKLDPANANVHVNLGITLARKGQLEQAIASFRAAIKRKPDLAQAYANLGHALALKGQSEEALAAYRQLLKLAPNHPMANDQFAWFLATCPDTKFRNATRAVDLAKKATQAAPTNGDCWNTLGVARYRAGQWSEAGAALEKAGKLRKGGDGANCFFLAMAYWQLNDKDKARAWYEKAVAWMDKHDPKDAELKRFRDEATALLGLAKATEAQQKRN